MAEDDAKVMRKMLMRRRNPFALEADWKGDYWLQKSSGAWSSRSDRKHAESLRNHLQKSLEARSEEVEEDDDDDPDREALRFRERWNSLWSGYFGFFDDTTIIPSMRYTDEPPVGTIFPCNTLQVFSTKIAGIGGSFQWPIDVFGLVAIRDSVDQNRNIIFQRSRVECQTLTGEDSYLVLTGPTRAETSTKTKLVKWTMFFRMIELYDPYIQVVTNHYKARSLVCIL